MTDDVENSIENQPALTEEDCSNERPSLLVVEDDVELLSFIASGFSDNYDVIEAGNGQIGLLKARTFIPDLVITDLMMPVMDGISLCRELKKNPETSHIPVIMLTAKNSMDSQLEGLETGADDYITKPFHMVLLEARISNLLKNRQMLREQFSKQFIAGEQQPFLENAVDRQFMAKVLKILEDNYSDWGFKSDDFASALNMGVRTLQRKLKAVADQTPASFINEFRMMKAAKLLVGTTGSITDIAFQVGCDESSHFTRMFKKYYDMSPSKYRAAHCPSN
jgi:YesN/AraC family two-component response regulator